MFILIVVFMVIIVVKASELANIVREGPHHRGRRSQDPMDLGASLFWWSTYGPLTKNSDYAAQSIYRYRIH